VGFLLMQVLLLIDFGYSWNEKWIEYDEASDNESCCGWKLAVLLSAALLYIGSITSWVLMFLWFGPQNCPGQQTLISVTIILCVALTAISCSKIAPHGTLLTSAVVTAYCSFLCYSGLSSSSNAACNPYAVRSEGVLQLIGGLLIAALSMASTAYSWAGSKAALIGRGSGSSLTAPLDASAGGATSSTAASSDEEEIEAESWWYFHLMMTACSLYMAMLLTDWSSQLATDPPSLDGGVGNDVSFYVKFSSQWVCFLLYGWTLLAPYLLREHRDFGIEFDFD